MDHISHSLRKPFDELLVPGISSVLIVLFLFFIDEGYYNFQWVAQPGSWVVFSIYLGIVFPFLWMISYFIFRRMTGWKKLAAVSLSGLMLTMMIAFGFFT